MNRKLMKEAFVEDIHITCGLAKGFNKESLAFRIFIRNDSQLLPHQTLKLVKIIEL